MTLVEMNDSQIIIRTVKKRDIPFVSKLITNNFSSDEYKSYDSTQLKSFLIPNSIERLLVSIKKPQTFSYVAETKDKTLVGFVMLRYDEDKGTKGGWRIRRLHIHKEYQGKGFGKTLLEFAYKFVKERGEDMIYGDATINMMPYLIKTRWKGEIISKQVKYLNNKNELINVDVQKFLCYKKLI